MQIVYNMQRKTVRVLDNAGKTRIGFVGVPNPDIFAHTLARLVDCATLPTVQREVHMPGD